MIDRLRRPTPGALMLSVLLVAAISVTGLVLSITALQTRVDERGAQATRDAVCAMLSSQIVRPGEPLPTTERGRFTAARALEQYRALGCQPVR